VPVPLKIGIIGLGFGSLVHVPAFRSDKRCRVVAIAGRDPEKAANIAGRLSIEGSHGDWRSIVENPEIDAVSIAVPPREQAAIATAALHAGKHLFCEKPVAASGSEAARLLEAAKAHGIVHAIDFIFPELPLWIMAREVICDNELGQIRHAVLDWRVETYASKTKARSWKNDSDRGGGVLNNFVSHAVHNIRWLFGEIESVSATLRGPRDSAETCAQATLDMEAGFPVFVSVASDAFLGHGHCLTVHGEEGTMVLENRTADYASGFELRVGTRASGKLQLIERDEPQPGVDGRVAPVARLASRFLDAILNGATMSPNFADGLRAQLILDEMRASNQTNLRSAKKPAPPQ
jgi:predicted dehydrogenase